MSDTDTTTAQIPDWQSQAIVTTERVNSVVSICSIMFILVTFLCFPSFNKPINRLIFFAGWGNLGSTIASLISEAGPLAGPDSALCQFQGFLVQMYLPLWLTLSILSIVCWLGTGSSESIHIGLFAWQSMSILPSFEDTVSSSCVLWIFHTSWSVTAWHSSQLWSSYSSQMTIVREFMVRQSSGAG